MEDIRVTTIDGSLLTGPGDLLRRVRDPGRTAAIGEPTETGAEVPDEEAIKEEIALDGEVRAAKEIRPGGTVGSKWDAEEMDELIPGRHLVDWGLHCSGPHWPLPGTATTEEPAHLRRRTKWFTGTRPSRLSTPLAGQEGRERTSVGLAETICIKLETLTHRPEADLSRDLMAFRSSATRIRD